MVGTVDRLAVGVLRSGRGGHVQSKAGLWRQAGGGSCAGAEGGGLVLQGGEACGGDGRVVWG